MNSETLEHVDCTDPYPHLNHPYMSNDGWVWCEGIGNPEDIPLEGGA